MTRQDEQQTEHAELDLETETVRDLEPDDESADQVRGGVKTYGCTPTLSPS